ncbi:unnamed protein product, partial [Vitis vinifera]
MSPTYLLVVLLGLVVLTAPSLADYPKHPPFEKPPPEHKPPWRSHLLNTNQPHWKNLPRGRSHSQNTSHQPQLANHLRERTANSSAQATPQTSYSHPSQLSDFDQYE